MRHAANNFDILEMEKIMDFLRGKGKKGYLALNVIVYDSEENKVRQILRAAKKSGVNAVILWDMAVLSAAKELGIGIHLSTQASVSNFEALKAYASLGVERVVLARECGLSDITRIIRRAEDEKLNCDVETFVHGAMCVSLSGRCFLSQHSFHKSANRGECIQPCRREFTIADVDISSRDECRYVLGKDYILSTKDLCTIGFLDTLIGSGISSFKIEGRMRSPEYVAVTTSVYRKAIDAFFEGKLNEGLKEKLLDRLRHVFNRGFEDGFYFGKPDKLGGVARKEYEKIYLGEVAKFYKKIGVAEILVRNEGLRKGQEILITGSNTPAAFTKAEEMQIDHEPVDFVERGRAVGVKIPFKVRPGDKVFLWRE